MKSIKTIVGVTLLEIMLVLAIAAMVIVLSIKYYQSANSSSQANAIMGSLQSITAAAENIAQGSGSYTSVTTDSLKTVLPASTFTSPWGSTVSFSGGTGTFTVTVTKTPTAVCTLISPKLKADTHTATSSCTAGADLSYIYNSNP